MITPSLGPREACGRANTVAAMFTLCPPAVMTRAPVPPRFPLPPSLSRPCLRGRFRGRDGPALLSGLCVFSLRNPRVSPHFPTALPRQDPPATEHTWPLHPQV